MEVRCSTFELYRVLWAASFLADELRLKIKDGVMKTSLKDSANVMALIAEIPVEAEGELEVGLGHVNSLVKFLSKTKDRKILLEFNGKLRLITGTLTYTVKLAESSLISSDFKTKLNMDNFVEFLTTGKAFKDVVKLAKTVSYEVIFEAKEGVLKAIAEGDTVSVEIELGDLHRDVRAKYGIDYLEIISKSLRNDDAVLLKFDTDEPLAVCVDYPKMCFLLAPRIE